jgi:hypothetical protein
LASRASRRNGLRRHETFHRVSFGPLLTCCPGQPASLRMVRFWGGVGRAGNGLDRRMAQFVSRPGAVPLSDQVRSTCTGRGDRSRPG